MDEQTKRKIVNRYVAAEPRVRMACRMIANRYGLRWHERQDLEQELWLALAAEWCRRDSAGVSEIGKCDADPLLPNEMDWLWGQWIGGSSSNEAGAHNDKPPLLACDLPCPRLAAYSTPSTDAIRLTDMRLDVAVLLDRLPTEDRCCCQRLIAALSATVHTLSADPFPLETSRLQALRFSFEAHGFRDYL